MTSRPRTYRTDRTGARAVLAAAALAASTLCLAGCTTFGGGTDSSPSTSPSAPAASASASPSATGVALPADCAGLVSPEVYAAIFGATPLNDAGFLGPDAARYGAVAPSVPPTNATTAETIDSAAQLRCLWRYPDADTTAISITVGNVDRTLGEQYLTELEAQGYTCADANDGRRCQRIQQNPTYPVQDGHTVFLRDTVVIGVSQSNYPTDDLLGDLTAAIWP